MTKARNDGPRHRSAPADAGHRSTPADLRRAVLELASMPVKVRGPTGRRHTTTLFEAVVERIASGQPSQRRSPIAFVRLVMSMARQDAGSSDTAPAPAPQVIRTAAELKQRVLARKIAEANTSDEVDAAFGEATKLARGLIHPDKRR